jgi:uncharacterized phiE125 gp8 family phage protein
MAIISVTANPGSEPLTIEEVKDNMGGVLGVDDSRIEQVIAAARKRVERTTNRRLIEQSLAIHFDHFPAGFVIELPVAPVSAISSVQYYDADGALQTFAASKYHTDLVSEPGRIVLKSGEAWETTEIGRPNAVVVNVVAGYGDSGADVPEGIVTAMLMMIEKALDRPDENYLKALDRVQTNELSPYMLRRFL